MVYRFQSALGKFTVWEELVQTFMRKQADLDDRLGKANIQRAVYRKELWDLLEESGEVLVTMRVPESRQVAVITSDTIKLYELMDEQGEVGGLKRLMGASSRLVDMLGLEYGTLFVFVRPTYPHSKWKWQATYVLSDVKELKNSEFRVIVPLTQVGNDLSEEQVKVCLNTLAYNVTEIQLARHRRLSTGQDQE
jgi:hypothetical protein